MADEEKQVELTPIEQRAMEQGWVPKDEWQGEEDGWRPAKEFLDRGELFKKIEAQNRTIKDFKRTLDELAKHNKEISAVEYKRALETLQNQKKAAISESDGDAVVQIEERIDLIKEEQKKLAQQPLTQTSEETHPDFVNWVSQNSWYDNNAPMRAWADALGRELAMQGKNPIDVLQEVSKQVKIEFPNKFTNPNRQKAGSVEGSSTRSSGNSGDYALTPDQQKAMRDFVRAGIMTEKEYIEQAKLKDGIVK